MKLTYCKWCLVEFRSGRADAKFCSARCRQASHSGFLVCDDCGLSVLRLVMRKDESLSCSPCAMDQQALADALSLEAVIDWCSETNSCVYCGDTAEEIEHVIPRHAGGRSTVPSCAECNRHAGGTIYNSIYEKQDGIHERLSEKYKKLLGMPEWDTDELSELSGRLKRYVIGSAAMAKIVKARLSWDLRMFVRD